MPSSVEIARFRDAGPVQHCVKVLTAAGIGHRVSNDSPVFDMMAIGRDRGSTAFIMVAAADEVTAREALLANARANTAADGLAGHYFQSFKDEELLEVLQQPLEWSPEDVAVAEVLLGQRNIPFTPAGYVASDGADTLDPENSSSPEPLLPGEKAASRLVIAVGYILGFGIFSIIIGGALFYSTEKGPDGRERYLYDSSSRTHGLVLMIVSLVLMALGALILNSR